MPQFRLRALPGGDHALDLDGATVAAISAQGSVDWFAAPVPPLAALPQQVHLSGTRGVQFHLVPPGMAGAPWRIEDATATDDGLALRFACADRRWRMQAIATCRLVDGVMGWLLERTFTAEATVPAGVFEYDNLYPARAYRGCLHGAAGKQYDRTIIEHGDGRLSAWPHQHALHYGSDTTGLFATQRFRVPSWGGFFGPGEDAVVLRLLRSDLPPWWAICDMYYDLHAQVRLDAPLPAGASWSMVSVLERLAPVAAAAALAQAVPVAVPAALREAHRFPAVGLGCNRLDRAIDVAEAAEAGYFRTGEGRAWLREGGHDGGGRLALACHGRAAWALEPAPHLPAGQRLSVCAWLRATGGASGRLRLTSRRWCWQGTPGMRTDATAASASVAGAGWERVEVALPPAPPGTIAEGLEETLVDLVLEAEGDGQVELSGLELRLA